MKPTHYVIAGLALVVVLLILFQPSPPDLDQQREQAYKTEIAILKLEKDEISSRFDSVVRMSQHKGKSDSVRLSAKDKEIRGFKVKLSQLREQIKEQVDTLPEIKRFIALQDSVIEKQGEVIDTLKASVDFQVNAIKELGKIHVDSEKIADDMLTKCESRLQEVTEDYRKQVRKAKRANRFLKAGAVVLGVGGFLLGSQF